MNLVMRHGDLYHGDLYRNMSRYLADRVSRTPRVQIWRNSEVRELVGSGAASAVGEGAIAVRQVHDFLGAAGRR